MPQKEKIKVFICDDHQSFSGGLELFFQHSVKFQFKGSATTEEECLAKLKENEVDILLLDIKLEGDEEGGIKIAEKILEKATIEFPAPIIVFLTAHSNEEFIDKAHNMGCSFLEKYLQVPEIMTKLENIYVYNRRIIEVKSSSSAEVNPIREQLQSTLSVMEGRIAVNLYVLGSNDEIAKKLYISKNTVNTHLRNIYAKLEFKNVNNKREELIKMVARSGLARYIDEIDKKPENWFGKKRCRP